jgi:hypothetical protein
MKNPFPEIKEDKLHASKELYTGDHKIISTKIDYMERGRTYFEFVSMNAS